MTAGTEQSEFPVPVFLCKRVTETPVFWLPYNAGFPFSLYLRHQNNCLENIYILYLPLFNSVAKKTILRQKKYWRGIAPTLQPPPPQITPMPVPATNPLSSSV
jgi:hypothetical protein